MTTRITQFGTSRVQQALADLFSHEARGAGQAIGPIAIVQTSRSPERAGRMRTFARPDGGPVIWRGLGNGAPQERGVDGWSADRGLSAEADRGESKELFARDMANRTSGT